MSRLWPLTGLALGLPLMACEPSPPDAPLESRWRGQLACAEGPKDLVLSLAEAPDGRLRALFAFSPSAARPGGPSGAFRLEGRREGEALRLEPKAWVRPAEGLDMARVSGRWGESMIEGALEGMNGCASFLVAPE